MATRSSADNGPMITRRSDRGLSIAGTRVTLYRVMELLKKSWPRNLIRDELNLTEDQFTAALDYIAVHSEQVEAECQEVAKEGEAVGRYWEERNKDVMARLRSVPVVPGQEALREKLLARKARTETDA